MAVSLFMVVYLRSLNRKIDKEEAGKQSAEGGAESVGEMAGLKILIIRNSDTCYKNKNSITYSIYR